MKMKTGIPIAGIDEEHFHDLLADYLRRVDAGEAVDQAAFIAEHAQYADHLTAYFSGAAVVEEMAGPPAAIGQGTVHLFDAETSADFKPARNTSECPSGNALRKGFPVAFSIPDFRR